MLYFLGFLVLALILCVIYAVITLLEIPGLAEERLGRLEPLPPLDEWFAQEDDANNRDAPVDAHLVREVRIFHDPASIFGRRLIKQVRYRDRNTDEVVRTEPDRPYRRRRVK